VYFCHLKDVWVRFEWRWKFWAAQWTDTFFCIMKSSVGIISVLWFFGWRFCKINNLLALRLCSRKVHSCFPQWWTKTKMVHTSSQVIFFNSNCWWIWLRASMLDCCCCSRIINSFAKIGDTSRNETPPVLWSDCFHLNVQIVALQLLHLIFFSMDLVQPDVCDPDYT